MQELILTDQLHTDKIIRQKEQLRVEKHLIISFRVFPKIQMDQSRIF
jgi:hypothetical protein